MKTIKTPSSRTVHLFKMKKLAVLTLLLFLSTTSYSQFDISNFEHAAAIPTGNIQNTASYGIYFFSFEGNTERVFNSFGYRLGIGVIKQLDIKVNYQLLHGEYIDNLHAIQIAPKFSNKTGLVALKTVFGIFLRKDEDYRGNSHYETFFQFSPRVLITPYTSKSFDLTFTATGDFLFDKDYTSSALGMNAGFGFSSDFEIWAVRPEIGFMKDVSKDSGKGVIWSAGLGVTFNIRYKKE